MQPASPILNSETRWSIHGRKNSSRITTKSHTFSKENNTAQRPPTEKWTGTHKDVKMKNNVGNGFDRKKFRRINIPEVRHRKSENQPTTWPSTRNRKSQSAEPLQKLQKISSPEKLEESESDEELQRQVEQVDSENPIERFQQSQTLVTSKDTEAEGSTLAIKRVNSNTGSPSSSSGPKTQEEFALKNTKKK